MRPNRVVMIRLTWKDLRMTWTPRMNRFHRQDGWIWCVALSLLVHTAVGRSAEPIDTTSVAAPAVVSTAAVGLSPAVSVQGVRQHVEYLAGPELRGRSGRDAERAAGYLVDSFRQSGLKPLFADNSYYQEIPGSPDEQGVTPVMGRNVGGWIPGSDPDLRDEFIIISAHYDHLGIRDGRIYAGADDNASGVAMVLELARRMSQSGTRLRRSVIFLGFDLEEHLLWGSRWFVAHPPCELSQVKMFITADMIGRSLGDLPLPTVFVMGGEHSPQLRQTLDRVDVPEGLEMARMGVDLIGTRSDYGAFWANEIPFLFFSTGEHEDYHSPNDTPARINYERLARVSTLIERVAIDVANRDDAPQWTNDVPPQLSEAEALNRIAGLLLSQEGDRQLGSLQKVLISHAATKTKQIIDRGEMTTSERTWLTRVAQLMLFSVFKAASLPDICREESLGFERIRQMLDLLFRESHPIQQEHQPSRNDDRRQAVPALQTTEVGRNILVELVLKLRQVGCQVEFERPDLAERTGHKTTQRRHRGRLEPGEQPLQHPAETEQTDGAADDKNCDCRQCRDRHVPVQNVFQQTSDVTVLSENQQDERTADTRQNHRANAKHAT